MKKSLRRSIQLFKFKDRIRLYFILVCKKIQIGIPNSLDRLFQQFIQYADFFEKGVVLRNEDAIFFRAELTINNKALTVFVRKESSDLEVLESVLLNQEYKVATQALMKNTIKSNFNIIDAGGNIGLTTLYFFSFFPASRFIIIEPDKENLTVLNKNLKANGISNAVVLQKALWIGDERLIIDNSFRDGKEWSLSVNKCEGTSQNNTNNQIDGISLQRICADYKISEVDLFKMDIEGAERFLFTDNDFISAIETYIKKMVIEIHDEFNIRDTIIGEMKKALFLATESGDVTYFERQ